MGVCSVLKTWFFFHLMIGLTFIVSGLVINIFQVVVFIAIWPFSKDLFRRINTYLVYSLWSQLVFLAEWWSGSDCKVYLDPEDKKYPGNEHAIVIMNHTYEVDWLMGWMLCERFGILGNSKVYVKKPLKYVPVLGWAWVFAECIFLERNWQRDKHNLLKQLKALGDYTLKFWILLFCEGTRFTPEKHLASMEFAKKKGLAMLKHHLVPRAKGFVLSLQGLKEKLPAVYDVTIGFRKEGAEPTLLNILNGRACQGEVFVRRIPRESIPAESEEACTEWLYKLYKEKDDLLEGFLRNGHFDGHSFSIPRKPYTLINQLVWTVLLCLPIIYYAVKLLLTGSAHIIVIVALFIILASAAIHKFIGITQIKKGSSYGKFAVGNGETIVNGSKKYI